MALPATEDHAEDGVIRLAAVDGVLILTLDPRTSFEALRQGIRDTFAASPDRFRGMDARLDLVTRNIDLFDLRRLVHVLKDEAGVTVTGLYCTNESLQRYAERELKLRVYTHRAPTVAPPEPEPEVLVIDEVVEAVPEEIIDEILDEVAPTDTAPTDSTVVDESTEGGRSVLNIESTLRSGQIIRFGGDVTVYGDLNPGAEVIAAGNIIVFGSIKGMCHAGSGGDDDAIIMCFDFRPTQLRIGRKIAYPAEASRGVKPAKAAYSPELAWVSGETIVIEPYRGRLPR